MGFSKEMATPVVDYPGNRNIEAVVNGVVEHETDPDIDAMPSERARRIKEVEEMLMEREKEMERIRVGKEQEKRIVEGIARRRICALQESDKELERSWWERVRQRWDAVKDNDVKVKTTFDTLLTYTQNVANNPNEEKFRKIRLSNATFQARVGAIRGGIGFLELCGFQRFERIDGVKFLFLLRDEVDMEVLNSALFELNNAINNPVFGVL